MTTVDQDFRERAAHIPAYGMGLSVDVYSPSLPELIENLERARLPFGYLEIFKAPEQVLANLRTRQPHYAYTYHADGLWVTQPCMTENPHIMSDLKETARHVQALHSSWLTQECASKQMGGHSFGTYLPPIFSRRSAELTASNVSFVQRTLDECWSGQHGTGPLFLLETPPLTYFAFGDMAYAEFFHRITELTSCGLVLDLGHIWTAYRYTDQWQLQSLSQFVKEFLANFPLERVVQIHVAGLGVHQSMKNQPKAFSNVPIPWVDAHDDPIPHQLFDMVADVLQTGRLIYLKGMALEVDTKDPELILAEYQEFYDRFHGWEKARPPVPIERNANFRTQLPEEILFDLKRAEEDLSRHYEDYVATITGSGKGKNLPLMDEPQSKTLLNGLAWYRNYYLPYEILVWSGNPLELFPRSCELLKRQGVDLRSFVSYWFSRSKPAEEPYDFFLIKIQQFVDFVEQISPMALDVARVEARQLREDYMLASNCEIPVPLWNESWSASGKE